MPLILKRILGARLGIYYCGIRIACNELVLLALNLIYARLKIGAFFCLYLTKNEGHF